jgi:MFS transporter, Spinster family, sphingosine-1-phosphate transporter
VSAVADEPDASQLATAAAHVAAAEESGHDKRAPKVRVAAFGSATLVILFLLNLIDEFDRAVLAVALDDIREDFGLSDVTVGLLPAAVIFITGLIAVPAGNWSDRYNRRTIMGAGALVWSGAGLLAAGAQNFLQLFLTRALLGFGQGTIGPTHMSILSDTYPARVRGRVLGYHRAANPAGQVLGALIGGVIIGAVGWRWGFVAAALPGLVFALIALKVLREPKRGQADLDDAMADNPMLAAFLREPEDRYTMRQSLGHIWRIRSLRYLIFANATFGFALFGMVFFLPTYFERSFGFTVEQAGAVQALIALGTFIGTWLGGPLADRNLAKGFGHLCRMGCLAALILAVCWPLAFAIGVAPITIALLAGSSLASSLAVPGVVAVVAATAPPRIRSQAFSYFGLALSVCGAATAPLLIGALSEVFQANGVDQADALRYSMLACVAVVMTIGTVLVVKASQHAEADVNTTITSFLAEMTSATDGSERQVGDQGGPSSLRPE